jgi:hypothetical protein
MAVFYGSTECPKCKAMTSQAITQYGQVQWCCCRLCQAVFRAEVDAQGRFVGSNVPMIGPSRRSYDS